MRNQPNKKNAGGGRTTMALAAAAAIAASAAAFKYVRTSDREGNERPGSSLSPAQPAARAPTPATSKPAAFTDVTVEAGLIFDHICADGRKYYLPEGIGSGGAFLDIDDDGDMDVFLVQSGIIGKDDPTHHSLLFRNDGAGRFEDVTEGSGGAVRGYGMGCAAADYDGDGDVDLYVTRLGSNVLLRNDGAGRFSDVSDDAGVADPGFSCSAAFLDFDRDGSPDLYVTNYTDWSAEKELTCYDSRGTRDYCNPLEYDAPSRDTLYRNLGNGRFENVTDSAGIGAACGNGLGILCTDFDDDGWVDVYVANDQTPAFLWINQRDGTFVEDAALRGCAYSGEGIAIAGMGTAAEDLDDDGDYDLLVTNLRGQAHLCLRNDGGMFDDVSLSTGFGGWAVPYTGFGVALFDQDHDGALDGFVANGAVARHAEPFAPDDHYAQPNQLFRRDAGGRFADASHDAGLDAQTPRISRGVVLGDYDNDGDMDVLVTNNCGPARLLRNESQSNGAWAVFDVTAADGNRHALNTRVTVETSDRVIRREVRPHSSYLSSHDPRLHFGLADAEKIDRMTVRWPDGETETWSDVPVNSHYKLVEGTPPQSQALRPRDRAAD